MKQLAYSVTCLRQLRPALALALMAITVSCRKPNATENVEREKPQSRELPAPTVVIPRTSPPGNSPPPRLDDETKAKIRDRMEAIRRDFSAFTPEEIMEVLTPADGYLPPSQGIFVTEYGEFLSRIGDPKLLAKHLRSFVNNSALISKLSMVGEHSPAVTPETLRSITSTFGSAYQWQCFANGLKNRIDNIKDKNQRLKLATLFLEATDNPKITAKLISAAVADMIDDDSSDVEGWLRSLPDEIASKADVSYIRAVFPSDPDVAIRYAESMFNQESPRRAESVLEALVQSFAEDNSVNAFDWALTLPDDLGEVRAKAVAEAYEFLKPEEQEAAKQRTREVFGNMETTRRVLHKIEEVDATREEMARQMKESQNGAS